MSNRAESFLVGLIGDGENDDGGGTHGAGGFREGVGEEVDHGRPLRGVIGHWSLVINQSANLMTNDQ